MDLRILDLDGSIPLQKAVTDRYHPAVIPLRPWGPGIRLTCSFGRFRRFERDLAAQLGGPVDLCPAQTLYGSGDFHHVSLALVRRVAVPFNLLVLDNHPDWMRGVPFLHCGTWLYHAARLPLLGRIFHVGGDVDFDNYYQWMAPWHWLRSGKITVLPSVRPFRRGAWAELAPEPLRPEPETSMTAERLMTLLHPFQTELASRPLYVSLDKDVMRERDAVVNWDSGHLMLDEVQVVLRTFFELAEGKLVGMDIVGDWSEVRLQGGLRRLMHGIMHPTLRVDPVDATHRNEQTNLAFLGGLLSPESRPAGGNPDLLSLTHR
jgi:hypothetical protein